MHSKEQIRALIDSGGRSRSQFSQFGRISSIYSPSRPALRPSTADLLHGVESGNGGDLRGSSSSVTVTIYWVGWVSSGRGRTGTGARTEPAEVEARSCRRNVRTVAARSSPTGDPGDPASTAGGAVVNGRSSKDDTPVTRHGPMPGWSVSLRRWPSGRTRSTLCGLSWMNCAPILLMVYASTVSAFWSTWKRHLVQGEHRVADSALRTT